MTYSFESPKVFDKLRIPADSDLRKVITISNPLGEDYSIMRTTTLNGMLTSLVRPTTTEETKTSVSMRSARYIFPSPLPLTELPDERVHFTLGMYGDGDFFDMKGVCEGILMKKRA